MYKCKELNPRGVVRDAGLGECMRVIARNRDRLPLSRVLRSFPQVVFTYTDGVYLMEFHGPGERRLSYIQGEPITAASLQLACGTPTSEGKTPPEPVEFDWDLDTGAIAPLRWFVDY
jgi:hypothetical protein